MEADSGALGTACRSCAANSRRRDRHGPPAVMGKNPDLCHSGFAR